MNELSAILTGFSVISCLLLFAVYAVSLPDMRKSATGKMACAALMLSLAAVQFAHFLYFSNGTALLSFRQYAALLAVIPVSYYFFSREILLVDLPLRMRDLTHSAWVLLVLLLPLPWAAPAAFLIGCGYTFYIYHKVLHLRSHIPRFRFEKFFFALFFAMNILALILGLSIPWIEATLFYHAYAGSISIAMILVVAALLIFPDLLSDVLLASETAYSKTKLGNIDIHQKRERLEQLMTIEKCFENENLTLASAAEQLGLSAQQLSELVNTNFQTSFPRYIRRHRIDAAKQMLIVEPNASVLSISMATGFKSQSSFYTAFKEHTGLAPASYRKAHRADNTTS